MPISSLPIENLYSLHLLINRWAIRVDKNNFCKLNSFRRHLTFNKYIQIK